MQPPKSKICVICGVRPADTKDHVPPKCFFKGVENAQFRTVPACGTCNNGASSDDDDVRFFISAQVGKQTPETKRLWEEGAHKTILRNKKLQKAFLATCRKIKVVGADGVVSTRTTFLVPIPQYQRVFERITRGLYFWHTGRILPASVAVEVEMLKRTAGMDLEAIRMLNVETVCDQAFVYRWCVAEENANCSVWVYQINHEHWVMASTGAVE